MLRRTICIFLMGCILSAAFLSGCSVPPLDEAFTEEAVLSAAEDIIGKVNEREYAAIYASAGAVLQSALSEQALADAFNPILDKLGAGKDVKKSVIYGATDTAKNEPYAVAIILYRYENGNAQFTISLDREYRLVGIYIK